MLERTAFRYASYRQVQPLVEPAGATSTHGGAVPQPPDTQQYTRRFGSCGLPQLVLVAWHRDARITSLLKSNKI